MQSKRIDITKPVRTRDGRTVTHLTKFDVSGYCLFGQEGNSVYRWLSNGKYIDNIEDHHLDLFNVPEKKVLPLQPGDIVPGDIIQDVYGQMYIICASNKEFIHIHGPLGYFAISFAGLVGKYHYSLDRGKTWKPCSKEIEE